MELIKKYKSELLIALGAVSSILATIATKEGADAAIISVAIAVLAVIIEVVKNGITDTAINLLAQTIKILIEEIGGKEVKPSVDGTVGTEKGLTIEEIKARLLSE